MATVTWVDSWRGDGVLERLRDLGDGWWWLAAVVTAIVTTFFVVREGEPPQYVPPDEDDEDYVARPIAYSVLDGPDGPLSVWALCESAARLLVFWNPDDEDQAAVADRLPVWQELLAPVRVHLVSEQEWTSAARAADRSSPTTCSATPKVRRRPGSGYRLPVRPCSAPTGIWPAGRWVAWRRSRSWSRPRPSR